MGQGAADGHYGAIFPLHEGRTMRRETLGRKETQRSLEVRRVLGAFLLVHLLPVRVTLTRWEALMAGGSQPNHARVRHTRVCVW